MDEPLKVVVEQSEPIPVHTSIATCFNSLDVIRDKLREANRELYRMHVLKDEQPVVVHEVNGVRLVVEQRDQKRWPSGYDLSLERRTQDALKKDHWISVYGCYVDREKITHGHINSSRIEKEDIYEAMLVLLLARLFVLPSNASTDKAE